MSEEIAVAFQCEGASLIGIVHRPAAPAERGVLVIVAGGPQFRAGCCRQLVEMARSFAAHGIPVMRFDYRGMGDSQGPLRGFQHVELDLAAAIRVFRETVPSLREIVLWGGCDAASAAMIHAWRLPEVCGMILGNPWVHSEETQNQVLVRHYYWQRLGERSFWKKVLSLRFDPRPALATVAAALRSRILSQQGVAPDADPTPTEGTPHFIDRMRDGIGRFPGHVLLLMSGRSLVSKELDEVIKQPTWRKALQKPASLRRHDIAEADQTFSSIEARREAIRAAREWLLRWPPAGDPARP